MPPPHAAIQKALYLISPNLAGMGIVKRIRQKVKQKARDIRDLREAEARLGIRWRSRHWLRTQEALQWIREWKDSFRRWQKDRIAVRREMHRRGIPPMRTFDGTGRNFSSTLQEMSLLIVHEFLEAKRKGTPLVGFGLRGKKEETTHAHVYTSEDQLEHAHINYNGKTLHLLIGRNFSNVGDKELRRGLDMTHTRELLHAHRLDPRLMKENGIVINIPLPASDPKVIALADRAARIRHQQTHIYQSAEAIARKAGHQMEAEEIRPIKKLLDNLGRPRPKKMGEKSIDEIPTTQS
jgi:hypothetical protein